MFGRNEVREKPNKSNKSIWLYLVPPHWKPSSASLHPNLRTSLQIDYGHINA